jgi:hypothetical protein
VLTRRHLLAASALVAAGSAAGVAAVGWRWWDQRASLPYAILSDDEAAIMDALAEACFPSGGTPEMGGRAAGVSHYFDGVMEGLAPAQQRLLKLALHAVESLPLPTHGGYLTELSTADASDAVGSWLHSGNAEIRGVAQSLTLFVGMAWFSHPLVAPGVAEHFMCGYAGMGGLPDRMTR